MTANDRVGDRAPRQQHRSRGGGWRATWTTATWLGLAMVVVLALGVLIGFQIHSNGPRMVAVFAIAVIAFLGILLLAHHVASYRPFDSGEMRMAIAGSFTIVYFVVLAIFLFSIINPTPFAQDYVRNLTTLMGVIIAFYFASSAAVQFAKIRADGNQPKGEGEGGDDIAAPEQDAPEHRAPEAALTAAADLLEEIQRLRGSLADLQASHERLATLVGGRGDKAEAGAP